MNLDFLYRSAAPTTLQDDPAAPLDFMLHDDDLALRQHLTTLDTPAFVRDVLGLFLRGRPVYPEFLKLLGRGWTAQPTPDGGPLLLTVTDFYRPDLLGATLHIAVASSGSELIQAVTLTLNAPPADVHALAAAYPEQLELHAEKPALILLPRTANLPVAKIRLTTEPTGFLTLEIICAPAAGHQNPPE